MVFQRSGFAEFADEWRDKEKSGVSGKQRQNQVDAVVQRYGHVAT